jgi:hypothetical protein
MARLMEIVSASTKPHPLVLRVGTFAAHYLFWVAALLLTLDALARNLGAFQMFRYAGF